MKRNNTIKSSKVEEEKQKQMKNEAEQRRNYMRDCRARKREEKKSQIENEPKTSEKVAKNDVDPETFVPFSTVVLTNRIRTPQDLQVRGHCKRPKPPRKTPKTPTERTREYRQRKKAQENVPEKVDQTKVLSENIEVEPSANSTIPSALQIGYVLPKAAISGAPLLLPFPLTTHSNALQIGNFNNFPPVQNVVLQQSYNNLTHNLTTSGQALFHSALMGTPTLPGALQIGNLGEILPFQNIVIPQTNLSGHSFLLPVPTVNPVMQNALQIGNLGQVLLIENNVLPQTPTPVPPPLVVVNGNKPVNSVVSNNCLDTKTCNQPVKSKTTTTASNTKTNKRPVKSRASVSSSNTKTSKRPEKCRISVNSTSTKKGNQLVKCTDRPVKSRTSVTPSNTKTSGRDFHDVIPTLRMLSAEYQFDQPEYWHPGGNESFPENCKDGRADSKKKNVKYSTRPCQQVKRVPNVRRERHRSLLDESIAIKQGYDKNIHDIENVFIKEERLDSDEETLFNTNYGTQDIEVITDFVKKEELDLEDLDEGRIY